MRKLLFSFICSVLCAATVIPAHGYQVGEAFVKDGVPCVVISVDKNGQHGLAMSLIPAAKAVKAAKKAKEHSWFFLPAKLKGADYSLRTQYRKEYYELYVCDSTMVHGAFHKSVVRPTTSRSGKENLENVKAFCAERGIDMKKFFPAEAWALSLGEGWYIPGADELHEFISMFGYEGFVINNGTGVKKKNIIKAADITQRYKELTQIYNASLEAMGEDAVSFREVVLFSPKSSSIFSSTMEKEMKMGLNLYCFPACQTVAKIPVSYWYEWGGTIEPSSMTCEVCAVCEF